MDCTCKLQADECTDGVAIFYPLQDGVTRPCGNDQDTSSIQPAKVCFLLGGSGSHSLRREPCGTLKRSAALIAV